MISVIVPSYNLKTCILRTLDSILAQTVADLEVIVVDDGSTDGSPTVIAEYAARTPQVRTIFKENGGVTSARLAGVRAARGEWIGFVDGDDELEPDMYARLLANAKSYGADISHCGYRMVFPDGRENMFYNTGALLVQDRTSGLAELLDGTRIEPSLCNKLYRRSLFPALLEQGALPENIRINEDLLMNFLLFRQAEVSVFEDFCPYHYLVRQDSATHQTLDPHRIYDPIRVKELILELAPQEVAANARAAYLRTCISVYNGLVLSGEKRPDDLKEVRRSILSRFGWTPALSRRQRLLATLIRRVPWCYKPLYGFYAAHLQKNPYV